MQTLGFGPCGQLTGDGSRALLLVQHVPCSWLLLIFSSYFLNTIQSINPAFEY